MKPLSSIRNPCPWIICAVSLLAAAPLVADTPQTVLSYTFSDTTGAPASTAAGVSASDLVRDDSTFTVYDNTSGNPAPDANSNGWTTAAAPDPALYYTFTITPAAGGTSWNAITLDLANFDAEAIDDGPTQFAVRSSLDGFTANLLTGTVGAGFATETAALSVTSTTPVEYRIYGFGAGTADGLLQIDNVSLTFDSAVPEPSAGSAVFLVSFLALIACVRRRGRSALPLAVSLLHPL